MAKHKRKRDATDVRTARSEPLTAATAELDRLSIKYEVHRTSRHHMIRWEIDGKPYAVTCSVSSSDERGVQNSRADVRRQLRRAGVEL